jgi:hypothetical protein
MSTLPFVAGDGIFALRLVGCACPQAAAPVFRTCSQACLCRASSPSNHVDLLSSFIFDFEIHPSLTF